MQRTTKLLPNSSAGRCGVAMFLGVGLLLWAAATDWSSRVREADPAVAACSHLISAQLCEDQSEALAHVREAGSLLGESERARFVREMHAIYLQVAVAVIGSGIVLACLVLAAAVDRKYRREPAPTSPDLMLPSFGSASWSAEALLQ